MNRTLCTLLLIACSMFAFAQQPNIIPQPVSLKTMPGTFSISKTTRLVVTDNGEKLTAGFLNDYLRKYYGFTLLTTKKATSNFISLNTRRFIKKPDNDERYTLKVTPKSVSITGDSYQGTFLGMQTLLQLLPTQKNTRLVVNAVDIEDYPKFAYRGMHLDVGRHFFDVNFVKKFIDFIALHKMNTFHWHLTEDQGWRIEIKKYPLLTKVGGFRNGTILGHHPGTGNTMEHYGGFYTQDEIKAVVKYAADRFITVIPEIEMPGHSSAAIAAYPQLSCFPGESTVVKDKVIWSGTRQGKQVQQSWGVYEDVFCPTEYTFSFLEDVLDEVIKLFPSQYIHIGGDESPKDSWKRSSFTQQLIKEKGLKDEHELQSYFIQRIEKYLNSKGKKIIGWDEILEGGLAANATVMSWRGEEGGIEAAKQNHQVIMTPGAYVYFDHAQGKPEDSLTIGGYLPLEKVYQYKPVPAALEGEQAKLVMGSQANVWTEYMNNPQKVEYMLFPRMSALSEVLWNDKKDYDDFKTRLTTQLKRYDLWKVNYSKAPYEIK